MSMRTGFLLCTATALAACADLPTQPEAAASAQLTPTLHAAMASTVATVWRFAPDGDLDDISTRVLPSLRNAAAAEELGVAINELRSQLAGGNHAAALQNIATARALLIPHPGDEADLARVSMVFDLTEALLAD